MLRESICLLATLVAALCLYIETTDECGANEDFLYCGPACPLNCSNQAEPAVCTDDSPDRCVQACFCKAGFLRNDSGDCVEKDQCFDVNPSDCADNEEFLECGSECPPSCGQPTPAPCPLTCVKGCFCKSGFLRDEVNDACVTIDQCSGDNCFSADEEFSLCSANCVATCEEPQPVCTHECASGCVCQPGLFRDDNGTCVSLDQCPLNNTATDIGLLASCLNLINKILHS